MNRDARWKLVAAAVFVVAAALFAREIANDFLWGHDGGNGAPAFGAADASVKLHTLGAIHGPPLLHVHLVVVRVVFGKVEWAARLVPFAYSMAILVVLYRIASRLFSRPFGVAAIALFTLTPLHAVFANVITPDPGGVFWTLCACDAAVRLFRNGSGSRRRIAVLATLALGFSWGSWFVLASLGLLVAVWQWRMPRGRARDRARSLLRLLGGIIAANAAAIVLLVLVSGSSLAEMKVAFFPRTSGLDAYVELLVKRIGDLYGGVIAGLIATGVVQLATRTWRRKLRSRDLLTASFFIGQLGACVAFQSPHAYSTYFGGAGCALLAADALVALTRWLTSRWRSWQVVVVVLVLLGVQTSAAWRRSEEGFLAGRFAYARPGAYDDQNEEVKLAQWLHARYGEDTLYTIDPMMAVREEVFFYLGAPHTSMLPPRPCPKAHCIALLDLSRQPEPTRIVELHRQAAHALAMRFGRRLVAVNLTAQPAAPQSFTLEAQPRSLLHSWLVSRRHPPYVWKPSPPVTLDEVLPAADLPTSTAESSKSGVLVDAPCPHDFAMLGIEVDDANDRFAAVRASCARGDERKATRWIGTPPSTPARVSECSSGEIVVGLVLRRPGELVGVRAACGSPPSEPRDAKAAGQLLLCPYDARVITLTGRLEESVVSGVGIGCR